MRRASALALAGGLLGARSGGAQTAPATLTLPVDVQVVQVTATVTDGGGRLVKGLRREDFHVFEDGRPEEVTHFIGSESERELVVAVDMSASMAPAMATCAEAVKRFLGTVRPVDHVTVLAFNDSVFTVARRDATPEVRLRAVGRLRAWGSTSFYDAVLKGLDLLEKNRGRRALVLFTDGEDMVSYATGSDDGLSRLEKFEDAGPWAGLGGKTTRSAYAKPRSNTFCRFAGKRPSPGTRPG